MSETFDLIAFADGSSYPTEEVVVYTNVKALREGEILKLQAQGLDANGNTTGATLEELAAYEAEYDLKRVEIEASALTFHLQGMPFRVAQKIANVFDEENPATEAEIKELILETITHVTNASGAKSSKPTLETLEKLELLMSPPEFGKILSGVVAVNFAAASYEADVDAGFPVGSADVE